MGNNHAPRGGPGADHGGAALGGPRADRGAPLGGPRADRGGSPLGGPRAPPVGTIFVAGFPTMISFDESSKFLPDKQFFLNLSPLPHRYTNAHFKKYKKPDKKMINPRISNIAIIVFATG